MLAKRFFYVSAALLMLALTYHLGARSADAQGGGSIVGYSTDNYGNTGHYVMTSDGNLYYRTSGGMFSPFLDPAPVLIGNYWGGVTASTPTTWGKVKADYRK